MGLRWTALALFLALAAAPPVGAEFDLSSRLEAFAAEQMGEHPTHVRIPSLEDFALPGRADDEIESEFRTQKTREFAGSVPVTVTLRDSDQVLKRGVVTLQVEVIAPVWVTTRDLSRGEIIGDGDLEQSERDESKLRGAAILDAAQLVGRRTRRMIRSGQPIRAHWIEEVPAVKRGDRVRLLFVSEGLRIESSGTVREDGRVGDVVRVRIEESRRELSGEVSADGAIHVAF